MKVIDLLNKIANGEIKIIEEPEKIEKLTFKKKVNNPVSKKMMYKINEIIDYINNN